MILYMDRCGIVRINIFNVKFSANNLLLPPSSPLLPVCLSYDLHTKHFTLPFLCVKQAEKHNGTVTTEHSHKTTNKQKTKEK